MWCRYLHTGVKHRSYLVAWQTPKFSMLTLMPIRKPLQAFQLNVYCFDGLLPGPWIILYIHDWKVWEATGIWLSPSYYSHGPSTRLFDPPHTCMAKGRGRHAQARMALIIQEIMLASLLQALNTGPW